MEKQKSVMKIIKYFGCILALLGLCTAGATVYVGLANRNAEPVLLSRPEAAHSRVLKMMDAFRDGDYATAQTVLYGTTDLGVARTPSDAVGALIWEAFQDSVSYELVGEYYATNSGLAQDVRITTMDMDSVTDYVEANAKTLLEKRVKESLDSKEGLDEIYDEENQYRDEFVMSILCETAQEAIDNHAQTVQTELTLNLVWADGQWWVVSNDTLLEAVSGGIVG